MSPTKITNINNSDYLPFRKYTNSQSITYIDLLIANKQLKLQFGGKLFIKIFFVFICLLIIGCSATPDIPESILENGRIDRIDKALQKSIGKAEEGDDRSQVEVGIAYLSGCFDSYAPDCIKFRYPGRNYIKAMSWFRKAADQGNYYASYNIGFMYLRGLGVHKDWSEAIRWFSKSIQETMKYDEVSFNGAREHLNIILTIKQQDIAEGGDKTAINAWLNAAEKGDPTAQYKVGSFYLFGQGIDNNVEKAIQWFQKAAVQNFLPAQTALGVIHDKLNYQLNYLGDDQRWKVDIIEDGDNSEAMQWFKEASIQGDAYAQFRMGISFIGKDTLQEIKFYRMAADQGNAQAKNKLQKLSQVKSAPKQISASTPSSVSNSDTAADNSSFLGIAGALIGGAIMGAVSPGDTLQQVATGLVAASSINLENSRKKIQEQSDNISQAPNQQGYMRGNISGDSTTTCPPNFNHLSSNMPEFHDSQLSDIRRDILATNLASIVAAAKQQGISKDQAISMALRQADEFESTARQNAAAGAGVSTELTTRGIVTAVKTGRLALNLPCSGSASMVQAAQCGVIMQIWGAMANREQAKFMETCW